MKMKTAVIRQGSRGNLNHNRRELLGEEHIDYEIENEVFVRQTLQEAYHGAFGKAVEEYNSGQKRKDRRIDDYYKHLFKCDYSPIVQEAIKRGKNKHAQKSFYENIIQIGNQYDTGVKRAPEDAKLATECLRLWFNGCPELNIPSYRERNPNIYVIESSIHVDEATPHIQLDYIPMSFINEKGNGKFGLSVQNSHSKALIEMGFGDDEYAIMRWREHEIEKYLVPIMNSRGIEWIPPDKENKREYMEKPEYKRFMDRIEGEVEIERERMMTELDSDFTQKTTEINDKIGEIQVKLQDYENLSVTVDEVGDIGTKQLIGRNIVVPPEQYTLLQEQAKAYRANKDEIENIRERSVNLDKRETHMNTVENNSWREIEERKKRQKLEEEKSKAEAEKIRQQAIKQREEAEQLWDMATMPNKFQDKYNLMEKQIAEYIPKIKQLEQTLQISVPCTEHEKVVRERNDMAISFDGVQRELSAIKPKFEAEQKKNAVLTAEIAEKDKTIGKLQTLCRDIYEGFTNVIKAVKMLKNKKSKYNIDNISEDTSRLIDSVTDYSADWAKQDGHSDLARDMQNNAGISEGIQEKIDALTLKQSYGKKL